MLDAYRRAMDLLYGLYATIAGLALVLIALIIPWGVFTRYALNSASSWPEPAAILLSIVLTFFGAAACYRVGLHMRVSFVRDRLPPLPRRLADLAAELLMALVGVFMAIWGYRALRRHLESIDRRVPVIVGRRHLSADPARRPRPDIIRDRAPLVRPAVGCAGRGAQRGLIA